MNKSFKKSFKWFLVTFALIAFAFGMTMLRGGLPEPHPVTNLPDTIYISLITFIFAALTVWQFVIGLYKWAARKED